MSTPINNLRLRWAVWILIVSAVIVFSYISLSESMGITWGGRWLILVLIVLAYQTLLVWSELGNNRRSEKDPLLKSFGWGTRVSLFRGLCIGLMAGFILNPKLEGSLAWLPAVLYTLGDFADYFDGYLARITNHETILGERLDLELDALGLLAAVTLAVWYGSLPWWFLFIGMARYVYAFGIWLRRKQGKPEYELPPSTSRRAIAGLTMGFISVTLWPIAPKIPTTIAGVVFMTPFAASFARDWLVVSGQLDPNSRRYRAFRSWAKRVLIQWTPIPIRLALLASVGPTAMRKAAQFTNEVARFADNGFPNPEIIVIVFGLLEAIGVILVSLGIAGRFAAFALLFPIGFTIVGFGLDFPRAIALVSTLSIMILGTGSYSIWKPSDQIFVRRAGERPG